MNQRTAKLLSAWAKHKELTKREYRALKRAWNDTPRPDRGELREHFLSQFAPDTRFAQAVARSVHGEKL